MSGFGRGGGRGGSSGGENYHGGNYRGRGESSSSGRGSFGNSGGRGGGGGYRGGRGGGAAPVINQIGPIDFLTNHYVLDLSNAVSVNIYRVDIETSADARAHSLQILRDRRKKVIDEYFKNKYRFFFDGDHLIVSPDNIPGGTAEIKMGKKAFMIDLQKVASNVKLSSVLSNEESREANAQTMQCLDIALLEAAGETCTVPNGKICLLNPTETGKSSMVSLREHVKASEAGAQKLWMGHSQSVQKSLMTSNNISSPQVTLVLNAAAAVAFDVMPFSLWTQQHLDLDVNRSDCFNNSACSVLSAKTRGLKFETHHCGKRTFKIVGIDPKKTAMTHSFDVDGKSMTVFQYFKERYKITLKHPHAPLLQIQPKSKNLYMPAEMVFIGRQNLTGKVSETLKKCMGDIMTMDPGHRRQYIEQEFEKVFGSNDVLKMFNIKLSPKMLECKGEVIVPPVVKYQQKSAQLKDGKWNMMGCRFNDGKNLRYYGVVNFAGDRYKTGIIEFFNRMVDQAPQVGMNLAQAPVYIEMNVRLEQLKFVVNDLVLKKKENKLLDILFVILPQKDTTIYRPVKAALDELVPTQCLVASKTPFINGNDRGAEGHIANILCKVNMKLEGTNQLIDHLQSVDKSLKDILGSDNSTCVIGVDVCHPSSAAAPRGQDRKAMPSFAAVVASVDTEMSKFVHLCSAQMGGVDIIESGSMHDMLKCLMEQRQQKCGRREWPSKIIYLRDGANEEAVSKLLDQEINVIDFVFKEAGQKKPLVLAVLVKKRHQTRFFPRDPNSDSRTNLPPGTLVMDHLSLPLQYDNFYLLSHAGIKGTSHPCRYVFVRDDFKQSLPMISKLSDVERVKKYAHMMYEMCHLYGRCQRAVSLPAPVFYAHLLADRSRIHADAICRKHTGLSVMDSVSVDSQDGTEKIVDDLDIEKMKIELKQCMGSLSDSTSSFFFC